MAKNIMAESSILAGPRPIIPPGPVPPEVDRHFDFLEWSPDGETLLLGSSNLTSRTWAGSVWLYHMDECKEAYQSEGWKPSAKACLIGASMDTGVTAGKFLDDPKKIVVGCDSGSLQILSVNSSASGKEQQNFKFEGQGTLSEHNSTVLGIDNLGGGNAHVVSCSQDKSIKVWDLDSLVSVNTFAPAHAHMVTSVSTQPAECNNRHSNVFASCALDGSALLWDTRNPKPATGLHKPKGVGFNSVAWANNVFVVLGGVDGKLSVMDIRNPTEPRATFQLLGRPVHALSSIPGSAGLVAACQDNTTVTVVQFTESEPPHSVFTNCRHEDFIRGLTWHPKSLTLWTCGWDSKVFMHQVQESVSLNGSV